MYIVVVAAVAPFFYEADVAEMPNHPGDADAYWEHIGDFVVCRQSVGDVVADGLDGFVAVLYNSLGYAAHAVASACCSLGVVSSWAAVPQARAGCMGVSQRGQCSLLCLWRWMRCWISLGFVLQMLPLQLSRWHWNMM